MEYCEYCRNAMGDTIYSIPLDNKGRRQSGMFCSLECTLNANRYQTDELVRSPDRSAQREQWIMKIYGNQQQIFNQGKKTKQ